MFDMKHKVLRVVIFFIILISSQITLSKILAIMKDMSLKLDIMLRQKNEDKFKS